MKITRKEIAPLVYLTCLTTDRFKTGCLSVWMLDQLCRETAASNALIPYVLRRGSASSPDMDAVARRLDELYGARIEPSVRKLGEIQCTGFVSTFIDDGVSPGGPVMEQAAALLCELLLTPNTRGGLLLPDYVESEKQKLLDRIRGLINDKRSYSIQRCRELMCFGEDYAVPAIGTEAEAEAIGYQKLTRRYRELLTGAPIEILYCGSVPPEKAAAVFRALLETLPRSEAVPELGTDIRLNSVEEGPRYFTEELDVTQGKLALGFRLGEYFDADHFPALYVFNALYGGSVNSKLFMNVREKLSLCYFASSGIDFDKGVMLVSSGIEFSKYGAALDEILAQLEALRRGEFTEEELNAARRSVSSDLRALGDSPGGLMSYWLAQNVRGTDCAPDALALLCEGVTADEVISAARSVECDAVYFLKGPEKEDSDGNAQI